MHCAKTMGSCCSGDCIMLNRDMDTKAILAFKTFSSEANKYVVNVAKATCKIKIMKSFKKGENNSKE